MDGLRSVHDDRMYCAYGEEYFEENGGALYLDEQEDEENTQDTPFTAFVDDGDDEYEEEDAG